MAGKIIKGEALPPPDAAAARLAAPRAAVVDAGVYDAHQRAKQIVEAANTEAARIRDEAARDKDKVFEKARADGYQAGLAQASEVLTRAHRERGELLGGAEKEVVGLAVKIAEKILGRELLQDPAAIVTVCAEAIEGLRVQRDLVLRVNPEDAAILKEQRKRLMDLLGRVKDLAIQEDPEVARGGCIIESDSGATIDAQLATQLEMIQRVLLGDGAASGAGFTKGAVKP